MLTQFSVSIACIIFVMGMVAVIIDNQYDCNRVHETKKEICYNGKLNLIVGINFIVSIMGSPFVIQGWRNYEPKQIVNNEATD